MGLQNTYAFSPVTQRFLILTILIPAQTRKRCGSIRPVFSKCRFFLAIPLIGSRVDGAEKRPSTFTHNACAFVLVFLVAMDRISLADKHEKPASAPKRAPRGLRIGLSQQPLGATQVHPQRTGMSRSRLYQWPEWPSDKR